MKLKTKKYYKSRKVTFRLSEAEYNNLLLRATLYNGGKMSEFIRYALKNYIINRSDLEGTHTDAQKEKK